MVQQDTQTWEYNKIKMSAKVRPIPLYTTAGDLGGFILYPYIFNPQGEWIGWVTADREVYSVFGKYVGWVSKDFRVLGKRTRSNDKVDRTPPDPPEKFIQPAHTPLPPMMAEIGPNAVDVLEERSELLPTMDSFAYSDES